jgi:uncharacterized protein (DUF488 family)
MSAPLLEPAPPAQQNTLWTIGHSNHPLDAFLDLLTRHRIEVLVDVRTSPYSAYASQFNREAIRPELQSRAIQYLYLGDLLGGRVEDERFIDGDGRVLYGRLAESPGFRKGIERLLGGIRQFRVAILCGEENPANCHRRLLVGRVMHEKGVNILHIRGDGSVQSEADLAADEQFRKTKGQKTLFETEEPEEWKSTQSVLPRKTPPSSSRLCGESESSD